MSYIKNSHTILLISYNDTEVYQTKTKHYMKDDVKMKDIRNAVPGGTMPQVGAMQQMQAAPKTSPVKAAPKVSPTQAAPKVSPVHEAQNVSPIQAAPKAPPAQTLPNILPVQTMPGMMPIQAAPNESPMQPIPDDMPVLAGPAGVMPSMMHQIPIMCCPYLMNMQCPMTYGANVMGMNMMNNPMLTGVSPAMDNMMPYGGNAGQVMGTANNMYALPGTGVMPSMNNQYFPTGGMNY